MSGELLTPARSHLADLLVLYGVACERAAVDRLSAVARGHLAYGIRHQIEVCLAELEGEDPDGVAMLRSSVSGWW